MGEIVDEGTLRALAHPVRWALIEALSIEGTATAARCAQLIGESHGTCSFHLRQLARYGIVEEAPTTSRRARPWRLTSSRQRWSGNPGSDAARYRAAAELSQVFVHRETDRIRRWVRDEAAAPDDWGRAAYQRGILTWMTPTELEEMAAAVTATMNAYIDRIEQPEHRPPGARPVRLFATGFPVLELDSVAEPKDVDVSTD